MKDFLAVTCQPVDLQGRYIPHWNEVFIKKQLLLVLWSRSTYILPLRVSNTSPDFDGKKAYKIAKIEKIDERHF